MNIEKIKNNERQFLALTSLYWAEFEALRSPFEHRWQQYFKHHTLRGERRSKPLTGRQLERSTNKLSSIDDKLFFILYFFKNNHLQESLAAQFDMNQSQVSRWIKALLPVLEQSIVDLHLQAASTMDELVRLFRNRQDGDGQAPVQSLQVDATERTIQRNLDAAAQEHDFSGKQYAHTLKNTVASDEYQFVHFAGFTHRGAIHDKTMIEPEMPHLKALEAFQLWFSKDKAYQGYQPQGVHLLEPFKATRSHPLTKFQKEFNRWLCSIRVVVEHAIAGIKRCRLVKETLRYFDTSFRDQVFRMACGLHNLRVSHRTLGCPQRLQLIRARMNVNFFPT
jgi:hypothetical protein